MSENNSYQVISIILIESNFKRGLDLNFNEQLEHKVDITVEPFRNDENEIFITLRLTYSYEKDGIKAIESFISFQGRFKSPENPAVSLDTFEKLNGPAILFPFIREHLANLSIKAMLPPIFLPSFNFSKLNEAKN